MFKLVSCLLVCFLCSLYCFAQNDEEIEQPRSLYESVVVPDRTLSRRLEQADRLFENGRSSEAAGLLGDALENANAAFIVPEESAEKPLRTLRQTASGYIIDRIRKLPNEAQASYVFQYEATAKRLFEDALSADSMDDIHLISQKYFPTVTGASAAFLVGLTQFERGDYIAAFLTLDKLKRHHPALPDTLSSMIEPMLTELQVKLKSLTEPSPTGVSESSWLEQIGWRLPSGSPAQNPITNASLPLFEQSWAVPLYTRLLEEREADALSQMIEMSEDVYIPASQPLVVGDLFITRTFNEIIAVDTVSGKRLWSAAASEYRFPNNMAVSSLPDNGIPHRFFFWHDRISHQLSSDGEKLFSIDDYDLQRMSVQSFGRFPKLRGNIEDPRYSLGNTLTARDAKTGRILWQAGKFPYVQKSIDMLFSQKPRTSRNPADQPIIDDVLFTEDEQALKETWFLGAPLPLQGRLYVIGETDGMLQLFVLDSQTGRVITKQIFAQIPSSLLANMARRTYPLFPSASSGVVLCPTGNGLVVAMDATTLAPLWCFTYAPAPTSQPVNRMLRNQQRQFPGMNVNDNYVRQLFDDSGWQVPSIVVVGDRVLVAPPDQAGLFCLDLRLGELLWEQSISRLNTLYLAGVQNGKVFMVTPSNLLAFDLKTGEDVTFKEHQFRTALKPAGVGVHSGEQYFIPFTEGYLAVADLNKGTLSWQNASGSAVPPPKKETATGSGSTLRVPGRYMGYDYSGYRRNMFSPNLMADNVFQKSLQFGNLVGIQGRFFSQSPTLIACFDQKEPLKKRAEELLQTDVNSPEGLLQQGRILNSDGKLAEAIEAFRASLKADASVEAADALRNHLLEALKKDYPKWSAAGQELESLAEMPLEQGTVFYAQIEGMLHSDQTQNLMAVLEKIFASELSPSTFIPISSTYAVQLSRALGSLFEQNLAKGHLAELKADWEGIADTLLLRLAEQQGIERLSMFTHIFRNTQAEKHANQMLQKKYAQQRLPLALHLQEKNTAVTDWSKLSSPYIWKSNQAEIIDVSASFSFDSLPPIDVNNQESQRTIQRLEKIARNSSSPRFGNEQLTVPFLEGDNSELASFNYVLRPWQQELLLCCSDSAGQEQWRLTLPMSGYQDFGRLPYNNEQVIYLKGYRNFLLFVYGNTMSALIVSEQQETTPTVLWTKSLSSMITSQQDSNRILNHLGQNLNIRAPFPKNSVFVSPETVCCWDAQYIYGLDPLTGQTQWVRKTVFENCTILGDTENLFLVFPDVRQVIAVDPASGRELATGLLPVAGIFTSGTNIVCVRILSSSDDSLALYVCDLRDMHDKRRRALLVADLPEGQWNPPIPETLIQDQLSFSTLIQMLQSNRFVSFATWRTKSLQIYDLRTKKHLFPKDNDLLKFVPEGIIGTMRCDVELVDDKVLVLFTKNINFRRDYREILQKNDRSLNRSFSPAQGVLCYGVGEGAMMLFDSLGKPCWDNPVEITNWSRLLNVQDRLPVVLFANSITDTEMIDDKPARPSEPLTGIMGIDKRTGKRVFRTAVVTAPPSRPSLQPFRVHVDPQSQEIFFMTLQDRQPRVVKAVFSDKAGRE